VQAYHKHPDYEHIWSQHSSQQRRLSSTSTGSITQFVPPLDRPAEKCGCIIFKDSKLVLFYTNDLLENPAEPVLLGSDAQAVQCVHGLAKLSRWTGTEVLNRTDFLVAAPIVAYNMFMSGVDCMDQYHSTLATQCKEMRLQMTLFTYLLDLAISQAFALHQKMASDQRDKPISFFNFKRKVCEQLVTPWMTAARRCSRTSPDTSEHTNERSQEGNPTIEQTLGTIDETHMLVENLPRRSNPYRPQDIDCFLCRKMGKELKTSYSCVQCKKGFHVNYFTAFDYRGALSTSRKALLDVIFKSSCKPTLGNPSKFAPTSIAHLCLPSEKETKKPRALIRIKANNEINERRWQERRNKRYRRNANDERPRKDHMEEDDKEENGEDSDEVSYDVYEMNGEQSDEIKDDVDEENVEDSDSDENIDE
jgi:hypothetical protein